MRKMITHSESEWIKYRLALNNITQTDIAVCAGCTQSMVSQVIHGRKVSVNVTAALAKALEFKSFDELIAGASQEGTP